MKSNEFTKRIDESDGMMKNATEALPATFALPELQNQDAYLQYRFGLALASALAYERGEVKLPEEDPMGENMIIIARSKEEEEQLAMALRIFGKKNSSRMLANASSNEPKDTNTKSPSAPQYSRKLRKD